MDDQEFPPLIRDTAKRLAYVPDDPAVFTRIRARVLARTAEPRGVVALFDRWFRPLAATLVVVIALGIGSVAVTNADPVDELGTSVQLVLARGDLYGVE